MFISLLLIYLFGIVSCLCEEQLSVSLSSLQSFFRPCKFSLGMISFIRLDNFFGALKTKQFEIQWSRKYWKERLEDYEACINNICSSHISLNNNNHLVVIDAQTAGTLTLSLLTFLSSTRTPTRGMTLQMELSEFRCCHPCHRICFLPTCGIVQRFPGYAALSLSLPALLIFQRSY